MPERQAILLLLLVLVVITLVFNLYQTKPFAVVGSSGRLKQSDDDRTNLPARLAEAVFVATMLKLSGSYHQLFCPADQELGERPANHKPSLVGQLCEPWQNRELVEVLWNVLDSTMVGLEWSSGSGTAWLLRRGMRELHSVEHCKPWLEKIGSVFKAIDQDGRWHPHHVARADGKGCDQSLDDDWETMERIFGEYARFPRTQLQKKYAPEGFDLVEVDGRFRDGCIVQAASLDDPSRPMLIRPDYGMLLLDNAERLMYRKTAELPSHWLVVSFTNSIDETAIWMACPTSDDVFCLRARKRIAQYMQSIPRELVGRQYHSHMLRAKKDGVPGA